MTDKNQEKPKKQSKLRQVLAISAKEVAELLGISTRQVWRLKAAGKLPKPLFLGGSAKWKTADIDLFYECNFDMDQFNARKGA